MNRNDIIAFIAILFLLLSPVDNYACTIFKTTINGTTIIGNNEDWSDPNSKVWFLAPEPGKYGKVLFGFENGWAQAASVFRLYNFPSLTTGTFVFVDGQVDIRMFYDPFSPG